MTLVNGVTVLSWSTWWGRYLPAGSSVQERPPTLSHAPVCLPTLTLPSLHRSHVWAVDLTQPCSLCFLSSMSIFHLRVCPDTPCPMWPVFLECHLPAVFLVSSFSFAISQDNHFFFSKPQRQVNFCPHRLLCWNNPSFPKTPLGKQLISCLASFQFKCCLVPWLFEGIWWPWAVLVVPASHPPTSAWFLLAVTGWEGDHSVRPCIPTHFPCGHRTTRINTMKR